MLLEIVNFGLLVVHPTGEDAFLDAFKEQSLIDDTIDYSLLLFSYILLIEFLPMISLQISLVISYRNNVKRQTASEIVRQQMSTQTIVSN